jgi:hypothetical protein
MMDPLTAEHLRRDPVTLPGTLWGLVAFFNPMRYAVKLRHLQVFAERIRRQGLSLAVIELAYDDRPFEVDDRVADLVLHLRTDAVLWQRERLLNLGLAALPATCDKVMWVDNDLLFTNDDWVAQTCALLNTYLVVQPFDSVCWLPRDVVTLEPPPGAPTQRGMACTIAGRTDWRRALRSYLDHGVTGFAWAFRRALLERHGFYDGLIVGGADVVMAHAMYADEQTFLRHNWYARRFPPRVRAHAASWQRGFQQDVAASVAFVPGSVLHLWHGDAAGRRYVDRLEILCRADFDPEIDIVLNADRCWTWGTMKPDLRRELSEYFAGRREDS